MTGRGLRKALSKILGKLLGATLERPLGNTPWALGRALKALRKVPRKILVKKKWASLGRAPESFSTVSGGGL